MARIKNEYQEFGFISLFSQKRVRLDLRGRYFTRELTKSLPTSLYEKGGVPPPLGGDMGDLYF